MTYKLQTSLDRSDSKDGHTSGEIFERRNDESSNNLDLKNHFPVSAKTFPVMIVFSQTFLRMTNDYKITKKHYPRTNNESVLEFVLEKDPNLFLRKNNIKIYGTVAVPQTCLIDTGYATKLFSMLSVEIDSQLVSNNRSK